MVTWWQQWPERLQCELDRLREAGISVERDTAAVRQGVMRLRLQPEICGRPMRLVVTFPDLYPYFRFEIQAPDEDLPYHQNPETKSLCLLPRDTGQWDQDNTVASFIKDRIPLLLAAAQETNPEKVAGIEVQQAEPFEDYFSTTTGASLLVDSSWKIDSGVKHGPLRIGLCEPDEWSSLAFLRGAVLEVRDHENCLAAARPAISRLYQHRSLRCRWVRSTTRMKVFDPGMFFDRVRELDPQALGNREHPFQNGSIQIWGVLFPEETNVWRKEAEGWIFAVRFRREVTLQQEDFILPRLGN